MALGQHAPMQYARDEYPVSISSVEDNMAAMLHAPQPRTNVFAGSADRGIVGQSSATGLEATQVKNRLFPTPFAQRVGRDRKQISLSAMSQAKLAQRSALYSGILRCLRTRANAPSSAIPLASPSSIAFRSTASFASYSRSSRSRVRKAARTTSLAFSYLPLSTLARRY